MEDKITVIIKPKESIFESILKDSFTFSVMALCIYVSIGSSFWTFLTGFFFLSFLFIKVAGILKKVKTEHETITAAIEFLKSKQ